MANNTTTTSSSSSNEEWVSILVPASRLAEFLSNNIYPNVVTPPMVSRTASQDCTPLPPPAPTRASSEEYSPKNSDTGRRKVNVQPPPLARNINIELNGVVNEDNEDNEDFVDEFEVIGIRRYKGDGLWIVYKTAFETGRKPLKDFIEGEYFTRQEVCDLVNKWNKDAESAHPYSKRYCILCKNKAMQCSTICSVCDDKGFKKVIYG